MEQNRFYLTTLFVFLIIVAAAAAQPPRPHLVSLRQQLGLSTHLQLEWLPGTSGFDTLYVRDDFNRADIGPDWSLDPRYWALLDGELVLTADAISEWRYLAVFLPLHNTATRTLHSAAYKWGKQADSVGIGEGAFAMLIDEPSFLGSGYWLWRRTNQNSVWLYAIKDGAWEYTPGETKEYNRTDSNLPIPQGGDLITATVRNEAHSVFFDYDVNGSFDATVQDTSKEYAQGDTAYFGFFIHGQSLNNQVDDFTLTWIAADTVPPATVSDLRAIAGNASSLTLSWTSPGDNYWDGSAKVFDLRYATFPITPANFTNATPATNLPNPAPSGAQQSFTLNGLQSNTNYYFALRFYDEANNASRISNLGQSTTSAIRVATVLQLAGGCDQTGKVGTTLPQPVVVHVKDQFDAPFAGHAVNFAVTSGEAVFGNGATNFSVNTDAAGAAATTVSLGATTGLVEIEIIAAGLNNSPILCKATALAGAPADLVQVSGDHQLLSSGKKSAPLVVRATDEYGNSVVAAPTLFAITNGRGRFLDGSVSYSTQTALNGTASAELFASQTAGDTTTVVVSVSDSLSGTQVQTMFLIFTAKADSLMAVSGEGQTAPIETQLKEPLVVRVLDVFGVPVKNYSVTFTVIAGRGVLGNDSSNATIATDSSGLAATMWKLGPDPGLHQVAVEAQGLKGAPLTFNATGEGVSSVAEETTGLPREFALLQNAPNPARVATTIRFDLPEASDVTIVLFDVNGRVVHELMNAAMNAGTHFVHWDGRDTNGRTLRSGAYFYRMQAFSKVSGKRFEVARKLTVMR